MAHSWHRGPRPLAVLCAAALAFAAPQALALALGEPEMRSALGENVDLRIPVTIGKGESIEPSCFTLAPDPGATVPRLSVARVSLERSAQGTYLRIRSDSYVNEPALTLTIVAACPGRFAETRRDYSLLIDPRTRGKVTAVAARTAPSMTPAAPAPRPGMATSIPDAVATLIARIGDTLESIADAIFPRNRVAQKSYIEALRESNPPLAALGERDPIPVDTPIALPDLRTFSRGHAPSETQAAATPTQPAAPEPRVARAPVEPRPPLPRAAKRQSIAESLEPRPPRERTIPAPAEPRTAPREESVAAKASAPASKRPQPGFVLKLSSSEVDLTRSRAIDDRMRAQLRDRLMVLDADDQVAAVLALRNSVRQLETRVAELQLKLAGMPSSFPPPRTTEAPKAAPTPAARPEPVVAKPEPMVANPEPVGAKPEPVPKAEPPPVIESPRPAASEPVVAPAPPAPAEPPKVESAPAAIPVPVLSEAPAKVQPRPAGKTAPEPAIDWLYYGLWALAFLLVAAAATLAWRLARRGREDDFYDEAHAEVPAEDGNQIVIADEFREEPVFAEEPAPVAAQARREIDSDVELSTRLPDTNTDALRQRYIEERFPEIGKGAIVLEDPASVVKGARLFYEDGALARAVELLHYAIERRPEEVRNWLALFEIFRLERLTGEFAQLARRFREHHGKGEYWRKVQYFGREIDPGNELYAQAAVNTFETIGPSQARLLAAEASFDPVAENWLGMPMDFQNEVLANDLRKALMAEAGIHEQDLVPNPMPALRNIEMFSVA